MQVLLDDEFYAATGGEDQTVGQLAEEIGSHLLAEDRFLIAIRCDGAEIPPQQWEQVLADPIEQYERVEFQSESGPALAISVLTQAGELLGQTADQCAEVLDLLSQSRTSPAMQTLSTVFSSCDQAHHSVVQSVRLLELELDKIQAAGEPATAVIDELRTQLSQIKTALTAGDMVSLADMLQYEFGSTLSRWQTMIEALIQHIRATKRLEDDEE